MGVHTVIPVPNRPRQEDSKFKASLDYIVKPCLKTLNQKQNKEHHLLNKQENLSLLARTHVIKPGCWHVPWGLEKGPSLWLAYWLSNLAYLVSYRPLTVPDSLNKTYSI